MLDAAAGLFYPHGIHAVGVDAVAEAAGVTKKTLYDRFGSKDQLVAAYLRARDTRWRGWFREAVAAAAPGDRPVATVDALGTWLHREAPRGCAFVNALAELPTAEHPAREVITGQKRWLRETLIEVAAAAGASDAQAQTLAGQLFLVHEGLAATYATGASPDPVADARQAARALTHAACPSAWSRRG